MHFCPSPVLLSPSLKSEPAIILSFPVWTAIHHLLVLQETSHLYSNWSVILSWWFLFHNGFSAPHNCSARPNDYWLPKHPYLNKYFILVLVWPIEQIIDWLHRAAVAAWCINLLRMVRWVRQLYRRQCSSWFRGWIRYSSAVLWSIVMVKIFRFTTTTTPRRISYVGIRRISTGA